jgi:hypothetical protein
VRLDLGLSVDHDMIVSHLFEETVTDQTVDTREENSLADGVLGLVVLHGSLSGDDRLLIDGAL